jgi:hypothetical protein
MLKRRTDAEADLARALSAPARPWVKAQVHLELGKCADLAGDRNKAIAEYDRAIQLGYSAADAETIDLATRFKSAAYKG